jgi:hypothetical protein
MQVRSKSLPPSAAYVGRTSVPVPLTPVSAIPVMEGGAP